MSQRFAATAEAAPIRTPIAIATFFGLVEGDKDPNGNPTNRFRPDDAINRAEAAKIIALAVNGAGAVTMKVAVFGLRKG